MSDCRPPLASPSRPRYALPPGACDTHCHVFGPADVFPYAEGRSYTPPDAPQSRLAALHAHLGIRRAVVVQANCHGADHAALLDALACSEGRYRGVALLGRMRPRVGTRVARRRRARGPLQLRAPSGRRAGPGRLRPCGRPDRAAGLASVPASGRRPAAGLLPRALPLPFVIDHMGRVRAADGWTRRPFARCWTWRTCRAPG